MHVNRVIQRLHWCINTIFGRQKYFKQSFLAKSNYGLLLHMLSHLRMCYRPKQPIGKGG